jgi:flagellar motor protein MotB
VSQQPERHQQRTLPRIQRREIQHIDEGDSSVWAVSYADLLMVLLAFFVIFFSFDSPKEQNKGLQQLAQGLKSAGFGGPDPKTSATPSSASATTASSSRVGEAPNRIVSILGQGLAALGDNRVAVEGESLQLLLPDNAFSTGQYKLNANLRSRLDDIYETLRPFERDLQIVVIGHADAMKFAAPHNEYLGDNFDLSSLRALRGLQYLLAKGFPHDQISAQGAADGVRNSRTMSLKVSWKEARP